MLYRPDFIAGRPQSHVLSAVPPHVGKIETATIESGAREVFRPRHKRAEQMPIGKLTLELSIPHAQSLKDRRQVVRSLKDKLRHSFNASVAEMNEGGTVWNQATICAAVLSSSTQSVQQNLESMDSAAHRITQTLGAEIADSYAEILAES